MTLTKLAEAAEDACLFAVDHWGAVLDQPGAVEALRTLEQCFPGISDAIDTTQVARTAQADYDIAREGTP
jgi:hypothetical protein